MEQQDDDQTAAQLGRRERQLLEAVYRLGEGTVAQVRATLPDPPSYSAVRAMLGILESKGHLYHVQQRLNYVYRPAGNTKRAGQRALAHLVRTFFGSSGDQAAAALLALPDAKFSPAVRRKLEQRIAQAQRQAQREDR
ncbi:MAG TPA: BlaI/MecI/CopY family transcriptional regulator [Terriglobales bacterium]|nr:BlaI/MecI/CopY family transcriptional regulator [Terriglobales bacterium]